MLASSDALRPSRRSASAVVIGSYGSSQQLLPPEFGWRVRRPFSPTMRELLEATARDPRLSRNTLSVTEVPPLRSHTTEHRAACRDLPLLQPHHADSLRCHDAAVSHFGPRLMALMAMLTGFYRLSRRKAQVLLVDALGVFGVDWRVECGWARALSWPMVAGETMAP